MSLVYERNKFFKTDFEENLNNGTPEGIRVIDGFGVPLAVIGHGRAVGLILKVLRGLVYIRHDWKKPVTSFLNRF